MQTSAVAISAAAIERNADRAGARPRRSLRSQAAAILLCVVGLYYAATVASAVAALVVLLGTVQPAVA
jgi:hypothetical protein